MVDGAGKFNAAVHTEAVAQVRRALGSLEAHLVSRTFIVGNKVTLADIVIFSGLFYGFKFLFDGAFLAAFPSVHRWFVTLANQPQVKVPSPRSLAPTRSLVSGDGPVGYLCPLRVPCFVAVACVGAFSPVFIGSVR